MSFLSGALLTVSTPQPFIFTTIQTPAQYHYHWTGTRYRCRALPPAFGSITRCLDWYSDWPNLRGKGEFGWLRLTHLIMAKIRLTPPDLAGLTTTMKAWQNREWWSPSAVLQTPNIYGNRPLNRGRLGSSLNYTNTLPDPKLPLYQGELARPRRSRGIITCLTRDLSPYASVVWPDYFWNYLMSKL